MVTKLSLKVLCHRRSKVRIIVDHVESKDNIGVQLRCNCRHNFKKFGAIFDTGRVRGTCGGVVAVRRCLFDDLGLRCVVNSRVLGIACRNKNGAGKWGSDVDIKVA